jgi:rhodanese-related sulfurtransferase
MKNLLLILSVFVFACNSNGQQPGALPPAEFANAISKPNIQILDVRTAAEYQSGHIKGSLQANWLDATEFQSRTSHLDKNKPVYVYCLSGGRSGAAAQFLTQQGYQATNMSGGMNAWKRENMPVEGIDPNAKPTSLETYNSMLASGEVVLVDFGAVWCPPCVKMEPVLQSFMNDNKGKLTLIKMDGGLETALMKSLNVEALPTFILYKKGVEVKRKQGLVTKEEFTSWLK